MSTHRILTGRSYQSLTEPTDPTFNTMSSASRWLSNRLRSRIEMEKDLQQSRLIVYQKLNKFMGLDPLDLPADLVELALAKQAEQDEQAVEEDNCSPTSDICRNMPTPDFGGKPSVSVPISVEELGTSLELAEQAVEENPISPASEPCQNMALPEFGGEQADLVPASVGQLGKLSTPNIRPYHVPNCATHMAPARSPADVVPSPVLVMDFRNLQYRRHVKHLVDYTDVASMGGNTMGNIPAYSS